MKVRYVLLSWDFAIAVVAAIAVWWFGPPTVPHEVAGDFYSVGISVLSIIFSVFFAALANIMSTSDNQFVRFLEEDSLYTELIGTFQVTLILLFSALLVSLLAYVGTSVWGVENGAQPLIVLCFFLFMFLWGLLAAALSANDAILYAQRRAIFVKKAPPDSKS